MISSLGLIENSCSVILCKCWGHATPTLWQPSCSAISWHHISSITSQGSQPACVERNKHRARQSAILSPFFLCLLHAVATQPAASAHWPQPGLRPAMSCCRSMLVAPHRPWHPAQRPPWPHRRLLPPPRSLVSPARTCMHEQARPEAHWCSFASECPPSCYPYPSARRDCCPPLDSCSRDSRADTCTCTRATERCGCRDAVSAAGACCYSCLHAAVRLSSVVHFNLKLGAFAA